MTPLDPAPAPRHAATPSISAVVPMHDEEENAAAFLQELHGTLSALATDLEIVVVNDGSRDRTRDRVLAVAPACRVHYLELSRNFGKETAIQAGLDVASGDCVVILDADFQHPISIIPSMIDR